MPLSPEVTFPHEICVRIGPTITCSAFFAALDMGDRLTLHNKDGEHVVLAVQSIRTFAQGWGTPLETLIILTPCVGAVESAHAPQP